MKDERRREEEMNRRRDRDEERDRNEKREETEMKRDIMRRETPEHYIHIRFVFGINLQLHLHIWGFFGINYVIFLSRIVFLKQQR